MDQSFNFAQYKEHYLLTVLKTYCLRQDISVEMSLEDLGFISRDSLTHFYQALRHLIDELIECKRIEPIVSGNIYPGFSLEAEVNYIFTAGLGAKTKISKLVSCLCGFSNVFTLSSIVKPTN